MASPLGNIRGPKPLGKKQAFGHVPSKPTLQLLPEAQGHWLDSAGKVYTLRQKGPLLETFLKQEV